MSEEMKDQQSEVIEIEAIEVKEDLNLSISVDELTDEELELHLNPLKPYQFYNSLSKRSEKPVNDFIGNHIEGIERVIAKSFDATQPIVSFQVSGTFRSTKDNPKYIQGSNAVQPNITKWGDKYPKTDKKDNTYNGIDWHTVVSSLNTVVELIKAGYVVRFGIKEGGNDLKNFVSSQLLAFDLDNESNLLSIEQTLEICDNNLIAPLMIYYSPSGSPEYPKLRLIVAFDSGCDDYKRLRSMARRIRNVFPNATHADDPCRYFYGTIRPNEMYIGLVTRVNNLETLETSLPELPEEDKEEGKIEESSNNGERLNNVRLFYAFLSSKLGFSVQEDPTRLVDLWIDLLNEKKQANLHKGEWFDRGSQNGSKNSWNGTNPVKGSESGQGDSFVVSIQGDDSLAFNVDHGSFGSDLLELFYYLSYGSFDCAKMIKTGFYQNLLEICELHDLSYQEFIDSKTIALGEFYFPSHKAAHITNRGNFLLTFGCTPDDMKFDHARQQFYQWGKNDQNIWYWQSVDQIHIEFDLMRTFKQVTYEDKNGNEITPMATTKHVKEAIDTMKIELGISQMIPSEPCLSLKNGILLLNPDGTRKPKLIPHGENTKQYNLTYYSPVAYDPTDRPEDNEHLQAVISNIPDPVHLDVMLYTLAAGLDIKGYAASFDYLRMILAVGTKGRGGKDGLRLSFTLLLDPNRVSAVSLSDYIGAKEKPERIGDTDLYDCLWGSENHKMTRADQFDDLKDLKADITWNTRRFRMLHKNWREGKTIGINIQNLNCDAQFDTSKGAVSDRLAVVVFPFYYTTANDSKYNPNNPYHRIKDERYVNAGFVAENVSPALLNLLLDYYHKIWHEGYKPNYSYMSEYVQKNLAEHKHIYRAVEDIGLTVASNVQNSLATSYLKHLYYAWCIANGLLDGTVYGWDNKPINPNELNEPEDFKRVHHVMFAPIQNDRNDTDPIASNDKHFRKKLGQVFEGSIDFALEGRTAKVTKWKRSVTLGLTLGWDVPYWEHKD